MKLLGRTYTRKLLVTRCLVTEVEHRERPRGIYCVLGHAASEDLAAAVTAQRLQSVRVALKDTTRMGTRTL